MKRGQERMKRQGSHRESTVEVALTFENIRYTQPKRLINRSLRRLEGIWKKMAKKSKV